MSYRSLYHILYYWVLFCCSILQTKALRPETTVVTRSSLLRVLQQSHSPDEILDNVAQNINSRIDTDGSLSSLTLNRLLKRIISLDNAGTNEWRQILGPETQRIESLQRVIETSIESHSTKELVEITKSVSCIARLLGVTQPDDASRLVRPLVDYWKPLIQDISSVSLLKVYERSGLAWALDTCRLSHENVPDTSKLWDDLPFCVLPKLVDFPDLSVQTLQEQVTFRQEQVVTASAKRVPERRQTAWQGDAGVHDFAYSGKSMHRDVWSPLVRRVRDKLNEDTGQYYDGCLLNLYPKGESGMRFHIDPDQGTLWDYDTAVVSVGATRRFAFRKVGDTKEPPHNFYVFHGDLTYMFGDCQVTFQHKVDQADYKNETAARSSLVFKRSWSLG